jgi:8-oxo-dGTP diphosphatase
MSREYPPRPIVGIGIAVLRPGAILLARRGNPPSVGRWSLPGGAQELGETAEAAARRELHEETGLIVGPLHLAGQVDSIHRDPDGRVRYHYTIIDFAARWVGGEAVAGGDITELTWAKLDGLDEFALWSEALRVIGVARGLLGM